ncbi:alkene reductase [Streptomyces sp. BG9H]|uniref:Alkene reductase n=1 Tax=Streptomyces anatolicus TaxID=2675858 RepID=A0ABS6YJ09_9ACTN|nr:alkene reductase [Streptomyces anatolicus]MBW5421399.1 alkene reductase [Streptomyces anatolicus]
MRELLEPYRAGRLELANRLAMAPMTRGRADDVTGVPSPHAATYYRQRAGAGLLITEGVYVNALAKGGPGIPGLVTDAQTRGWREVTEAVHAEGGTVFAQLWHVGRMTHPSTLPDGELPVAPSAVAVEGEQIFTRDGLLDHVTPRELTMSEIAATVRDFASAARRAIDAGFDGVEIHGANGYLIQQFIGDNTNLRTDEYGGSVTGRLRFAREVVEAVVAEVGADRVGLRISPDNPVNQLAETDAPTTYRALVEALDPLGLAYLHVLENGAYGAIADLRPRWSGTLIANTNAPEPSSPEAGARLIRDGHADVVALGRLFMTNPDLPARLANGTPLAGPPTENVYGGGAEGYIDYPTATDAPGTPKSPAAAA